MTIRYSPNEFPAPAVRSRAIGEFFLTETRYEAESVLTTHVHESPCLIVVLSGPFAERAGGTERVIEPETVIVRPAGEVHSNFFGPSGGRCLNVELPARWLADVRRLAPALDRSGAFRSSAFKDAGRALYAVFLAGRRPLALESLILGVFGETESAAAPPPWLGRVRERLHDQPSEHVTLSQLAAVAGVHPVHLAATFRRCYGTTVAAYARRLRLENACRALAETEAPLADVASDCGFADQSHFGRTLMRSIGVTPAAYRGAVRARGHLRNASLGADAIVYERGPAIEMLDLRTEKTSAVSIHTPEVPQWREVDASRFITFSQPPLTEARGDLWIAGKNITNTSGVFEREASLSPDGRTIAYWSDRSGEYQLYVRGIGEAEGKPLTNYASGFRYRPVWSPDGSRLAFTEQTGDIVVFNIAQARATTVDREPWNAGIDPTELAWSADSAWLAYTKSAPNRLTAIWRYEVASGARQQLTSDMFAAATPLFDPSGEHLFFISFRNFDNVGYDWIQDRLTHRGLAVLMQVPLRGTAFTVDAFESAATRVPTASGSISDLTISRDGNPKYTVVDLAGNRSTRSYDMAAHRETVVEETSPKSESLPLRVDVRAEWRQIFNEAWRLYRDFLFAPNAPRVDWSAVKTRYEPMLARCKSREEVNLVLAQMIGESRVGHAYIGRGGDVASQVRPDAATLGADFEAAAAGLRITRIVRGGPLDGVAREGDVLRAVDGQPVSISRDPRAALVGLAGKHVRLTIGSADVEVVPIASENDLRRREWVEANRRRVAEASGGRIGYVHIPDFTASGFSEFARQYYGQIAKDALLIDARWSSGGSTGAILAELLARKPLNFAAGRYNESWPAPRYGVHFGPKALLVNHITVSAGENFSYYFRKLGLGPIIGERTWGGLTGLNPVPSLIDGGAVNVPNAPFFDKSGWLIEGRGLEPDITVDDDAAAQLDRAVNALLAGLARAE